MKLFVCIYDDCRLLPHFLRHYARFGVREFHVAAPASLASEVSRLAGGHLVKQYNDLDVEDSFLGGAAAVSAMRDLAQGPDEWAVIVDLDEFVEFGEPLAQIVSKVESENANIAQGIMFDRFAVDGQPKSFDDGSDLGEVFPVRARFIKTVMKGSDKKAVLVKGRLRNRVAHHSFRGQKPYSVAFAISHYKWNERALDRVRSAYDMLSAANAPWAEEFKRILDHYAENGRFAWETFGGENAESKSTAAGSEGAISTAADHGDAVAGLQALLDAKGDKAPPALYVRLAQAHRALGAVDDADAVIRLGLKRYPADLRLMTAHADAARRAVDWRQVVDRCQAVLASHADTAPARAYYRLAEAHQVLEAFADAEAVIRSGVERYPDNPKLMAMFAGAAFRAKQWGEAVSRSRAVLDLHEGKAPAAVYLQLAQALYVMGEAEEAGAVLDRGLALHPGNRLLLTQCPWRQPSGLHVSKRAKPLAEVGLSAEESFALEVEGLTRVGKYGQSVRPHFPRLVSSDRSSGMIVTQFMGVSLRCLSDTTFHQAVFDVDAQIAEILSTFEKTNLVHLDIIPDNIVVDEVGTISVIDFGMTVMDNAPVNEHLADRLERFLKSGGYRHQGECIRNFVMSACQAG